MKIEAKRYPINPYIHIPSETKTIMMDDTLTTPRRSNFQRTSHSWNIEFHVTVTLFDCSVIAWPVAHLNRFPGFHLVLYHADSPLKCWNRSGILCVILARFCPHYVSVCIRFLVFPLLHFMVAIFQHSLHGNFIAQS